MHPGYIKDETAVCMRVTKGVCIEISLFLWMPEEERACWPTELLNRTLWLYQQMTASKIMWKESITGSSQQGTWMARLMPRWHIPQDLCTQIAMQMSVDCYSVQRIIHETCETSTKYPKMHNGCIKKSNLIIKLRFCAIEIHVAEKRNPHCQGVIRGNNNVKVAN